MRSVIDANIAIYAVLPCTLHNSAIDLLERLVWEEIALYVPRL